MSQPRVLLGFAQASDHGVEETAGYVKAGLYQSPIYTKPPFIEEMLEQGLTTFTTAIAAQKNGGVQATAAKEEARLALIGLLRQLAAYVESVMLANPTYGLAELLASGFDAVSTNRARHALAVPSIRGIDNSGEGQLTLRVGAVPNARQYEVRYQTEGATAWQSAGLYNSTRGMVVHGLTPGAMYVFQVRATGGLNGASHWSDSVSHRNL